LIVAIVSFGQDGSVVTNNSDSLDAFGRLRTSDPESIWTFIPRTALHTDDLWDQETSGSATITLDTTATTVNLNTTTASGDEAIRASYRNFIYTPGKANSILMTCNFSGADANVRKRIGQFDSSDGWFWELNGSDLKVVIRSSASGSIVDNGVSQASWNLDKLDGSGPSGLTLDLDNVQILMLDYQWLGAGRVRFGFSIGGSIIYCHEFTQANLSPNLYSAHPHLPFRAEIKNLTSTVSPAVFKLTCFSISVEGGDKAQGIPVPVSSGTIETTIGSTETYLFSVSLRPAFHRQAIAPTSFQFISTSGTKAILIRVYYKGTLSGASWSDIGDISRYDTSGSLSGGKLLEGYYLDVGGATRIDPSGSFSADLNLGSSIDQTPVNLTVTAQTLGGTGKLLYAALLREYI
jgi:hypothetical protein